MLRRAVLALLLFAGLFGLGVAALWSQGWLPAQAHGDDHDAAHASAAAPAPPAATPVPSAPVPGGSVPGARVPRAPTPDAPTPDVRVVPPAPAPGPAPASTPAGAAGAALGAVNAVRALAEVGAVLPEPAWAGECAAHATYLARADRAEHREDPDSPHRSVAGEACAPGHYFVSSQAGSGAARAVAYWATGAFHLPQLIDPRLGRAALGVAHDEAGGVRSAAVLDVRRGLGERGAYPVRFPAPGRVSPYTAAATGEWPDPAPACGPGTGALGAPVALLLGPGGRVTDAALKVDGRPVAACLLTAATFRGASDGDTRAGRNVLAAQGAAVLLPRRPLPSGAEVRVSFGTSGGRVGWAFRVR